MFTETQLHFYKEKIAAIETALMINESSAVLTLPNRIIKVSYIDPVGHVWFFVPRPVQQLSEFDKAFPVTLLFFRKGSGLFFHVRGKAHLVIDPEEINELEYLPGNMKARAKNEDLLLRLHVSALHYRPLSVQPVHTVTETWLHAYQRLLHNQKLIFNHLLMKLHA